LPEHGVDSRELLDEAADLMFRFSLFNGHPRFYGYITSSPAPIGALGDLLASGDQPERWRLKVWLALKQVGSAGYDRRRHAARKVFARSGSAAS
jgi:hypothetical protein